MSTLKALRVAAKELVQVLGLVDKKKKDIVITNAMTDEDLTKIITDAIPLIDPAQDEFTDETQTVIDELSATEDDTQEEEKEEEPEEEEEAPKKKVVKKVVKEEAEEEEEEEDEKPTKVVKKGGPQKGVKPSFKKEGSMAQFMDETVKAGGTWDEMAAACKEEGESRGVNTKFTPSAIRAHAKFRVSKDAKFLGKLKITEDGVK